LTRSYAQVDAGPLIAARGARAQLCVIQHGRVVLDESYGCEPDALFWIFSASKPFTAVLTHELAVRGGLRLDDPVARYWPEFGARGKDAVTVRQVLQHRSGLSTARGLIGDALAMGQWSRSVRNLERAALRWAPGSIPAYQTIVYGFILGEVLRRATGVAPATLMETELLRPLGLGDMHLGLPDAYASRGVPVTGHRVMSWYVNRPAIRRAVIPSAGISATARSVAAFYQALLTGGGGVLSAEAIDTARTPSTTGGEIDQTFRSPIRWSQGFQLAGRSMGSHAGPSTFGHNGSNCCLAWADPEQDLVVAYLTDRLVPGPDHLRDISDAVRAACS
jgi:CubicO group peptidase (beta-lactamase class C family)